MIIFDTETTGLLVPEARGLKAQPQIIEFAAIKINDKTLKEKDRISFLVNPGIPLPSKIIDITGIKDSDLKNEGAFPSYYNKLIDFFLGERAMLAHNLPFDVGMLSNELRRIDRLLHFPWPPVHLDSVTLTEHINGHRLKLSELHTLACGKPHSGAHRAMADVEALLRCVRWMAKEGLMP